MSALEVQEALEQALSHDSANSDPETEVELAGSGDLHVLRERAGRILALLSRWRPQYDIEGYRNAWIVKPGGKSRGRGIRCYNRLSQIRDYCSGAEGGECQWVAQKYIERPLVVMKRKFDIRQFVLATGWNPLVVWFYDICYIRFCTEDFNLVNIDLDPNWRTST